MSSIPDGFGLIPGRGRDNARKVMAAAEAAGVDPTLVRTTDGGYLAPLDVLDAYEAAEKPAPKKAPAKKAPVKKTAVKEAEPASEEKE